MIDQITLTAIAIGASATAAASIIATIVVAVENGRLRARVRLHNREKLDWLPNAQPVWNEKTKRWHDPLTDKMVKGPLPRTKVFTN